MKKIRLLSIVTLSLIICSCDESIINLVPIGDTEETFFKNEDQMDMAVAGIYHKNSYFYVHLASQVNAMAHVYRLPSDDVTIPETGVVTENFNGLNDGDSRIADYYKYMYQMIARANAVLEKIEEVGNVAYAAHPERKDWNKGEALFFRAYAHFCLWNIFGTTPKATEFIRIINEAYLSSTEGTELLDVVIDDLAEAIKVLPTSWEAKYIGRVTKNAAYGMRAKALIFRGTVNKATADFTAALADINAISGRSLTATYRENFSSYHENNVESLFEQQANNSVGAPNFWLLSDEFSVIGDYTHWVGLYDNRPDWTQNWVHVATKPLIDAYEDGDPRKAYNLDLQVIANNGRHNIKKYIRDAVYTNKGGDAWFGAANNNPRILRYADILLLKAEAIVRSGGSLSEAIGLINQIRTRARNSDESGTPSGIPADLNVSESDRNKVLNWIFQERRLELAFEEGHRWWDLRRRHIAGEIDLKTLNFGSLDKGFQFRDHNVNFPIPGRELNANQNLKQNQGYGK